MIWIVLAFVLNLLHFTYHQIITWKDLFPFNSARSFSLKAKRMESITFGIIMFFPLVALVIQIDWMLQASAILLATILMLEYNKWWKPYFSDASDDWKKYHKKHYKDTLMWLNSRKSQPAPNAEHITLHLLSILCLISLLIVLIF